MSAHKTNFIRNHIDQELADGKITKPIITRFPPEPNGYLHIGHAKAICLNFGIARDYQGRCHLRLDDTNPCTENEEFTRAIQADIKWLGFDWGDYFFSASEYFEDIFKAAIGLIKSGKAYVCSLSAEEVRAYRGTLIEPGKNSPDRDRGIEENLDLFLRMRAGEFPEGKYTLRAKIDMASGNINLRDPALYRIRYAHHHKTKDTWCIYPMYDFAHALSDAIENISYSLCSLEFQDHRPLYNWCVEHCELPGRSPGKNTHPQQIEFSRLNLTRLMTSKRKLKNLVEQNIVSGWDDPRMPTLSGVRRRGYTPESLHKLCDAVGISKQDSVIDISVLEDCLRDDLNSKALRKMAVLKPLKIVLLNYSEDVNNPEVLSVPNHPQDESFGRRDLNFSKEILIDRDDFMEVPNPDFMRLIPGGRVRLMNAYVIECQKIIKNNLGEIDYLECVYLPETLHGKKPNDGQKVKGIIHWVSAKFGLKAEVRLFEDLFLIDNPGDAENYLDYLNPDSMKIIQDAWVEPSLNHAQPEERFQFNRLGYFVADIKDHQADDGRTSRLVFNRSVMLKTR